MKTTTYKAASTNEKKGYKTHGSFKMNSKNKKGSGDKPNKDAKEKASDYVSKRLRKVSKGLFFAKKGEPMRAQLNG